jgi:hypothetical protein
LNLNLEYLWECWKHFIQDVPLRIDALIVNGDAIDDQNVKEKGCFLSETDPEFQARGAAILLQPLLQRVVPGQDGRQHIYVSRGSRYHPTFDTHSPAVGRCCHPSAWRSGVGESPHRT